MLYSLEALKKTNFCLSTTITTNVYKICIIAGCVHYSIVIMEYYTDDYRIYSYYIYILLYIL